MSDIDVRGAVEALRPLVRQAKATVLLAEKLESLVGLEDFSKELAGKVETLKKVVESAAAKVVAAEAEAVRLCAEAKTQAAKVVADANEAAERRLNRAESEAESVKETAEEAARVQAEATLAARASYDTLVFDIRALTEKRDALVAEIDKFKSAASRIVG